MFYIVGTPIGNIEDLSLRQAKIIAGADILLTEDTRTTGMLLIQIEKLFGFKKSETQQLISYYKEREFEKLPYVFELIEQGKNIALISESGMPLVNDPGWLLVHELTLKNIPFTVVPGPTAAITGLVHSGFKMQHFVYFGFLSKKPSEVKKTFQKAQSVSALLDHAPCIFYETSLRIQETLMCLNGLFPLSKVAVCRELTKKFEEITRGTPSELLNKTYRGEIVLIVSF